MAPTYSGSMKKFSHFWKFFAGLFLEWVSRIKFTIKEGKFELNVFQEGQTANLRLQLKEIKNHQNVSKGLKLENWSMVFVPCRLMLTIMLSIFKESESEYNHVESESEEDKSGEAVWCNCRREDNDAS